MEEFEKFKRRRELQEPAENVKIGVMIFMVISVAVFTVMGKDNVKPIIWYWATFMALLVVGCIIQDLAIRRKIKREGSHE